MGMGEVAGHRPEAIRQGRQPGEGMYLLPFARARRGLCVHDADPGSTMMTRRMKTVLLAALLTTGLSGCTEHKTPVQDILNKDASISASTLPMNPLSWRVITSFANRNDHTMATLYGNDAAIASTRSETGFREGAVLSLVTWQQKEDPHWFGGSIPATPIRVEFVQAAL